MRTQRQWLFEAPTAFQEPLVQGAGEGFEPAWEWEAGSPINLASAVQYNQKNMSVLGWQPYVDEIVRLLGFTTFTPNPSIFAQAVADWQRTQGLTPDGKIGPNTWSRMKAALGLKSAPQAPSTAKPGKAVNSQVNVFLPPGLGLYSYKKPYRQFGLPETIKALLTIGAIWHKAHPKGPRIGIGDISLQGGGKMTGHASHQKGVDLDMRLVRNDGKEAPVTRFEPAYSRTLTQELVNIIRSNGVLKVQYIFFNDPAVKGVKKWPNHDNHLHIRFYPPPAGASKTPEFEYQEQPRFEVPWL